MKDKCQLLVKIMGMLAARTCLGCIYRSFGNLAEITILQTFTCNIPLRISPCASGLRVDGVRDAAGLSVLVMMTLCQFVPAKDLL